MNKLWGLGLILAGIYLLNRKKTLSMPVAELVSEHKRIVALLEKSSDPSLRSELAIQKRELESYIRQA
jgi:hypothetical protein